MGLHALTHPDVQAFIKAHEDDDVRALALKKPPEPDWDYPRIIDQIKARQKARTKMPQWLAIENVIFPPSDIIEQASSTATALFKTSLASGERFIDLTGGCGIDAWALSQSFTHGTIIEQNEAAAACLAHNLPALDVQHTQTEEFIKDMPEVDLVMIDPQRRNQNKRGLYQLNDCSPDITAILPDLKSKTKQILLKTSPILDIQKTIEDLGCVTHVYCVEWQGECKELLFLLTPQHPVKNPKIQATRINDEGTPTHLHNFTPDEEKSTPLQTSAPLKFLFEPSPAFQKAGGFKTLAMHFKTLKIAAHTNLYTAENDCPDFPGRRFKIIAQYPVQAKALPMRKANLTVRNFPMHVEALRKKLKLKEGGNDYLFACTLSDGAHVLIHGQKIL